MYCIILKTVWSLWWQFQLHATVGFALKLFECLHACVSLRSAVALSQTTLHTTTCCCCWNTWQFFQENILSPPDFGKKLSSLVPITNSSESSCQTQKHPRHDCRWQSRGSMDWWSGALHGRVVSPGDLIPLTFTWNANVKYWGHPSVSQFLDILVI